MHSKKAIKKFLWSLVEEELEIKQEILNTDQFFGQFQRISILKAIDENWVEQVDYLQQLRTALGSQYNSQKNPVVEYYQESYASFDRMKDKTKAQVVRNLLLSTVEVNKKGEIIMHFP